MVGHSSTGRLILGCGAVLFALLVVVNALITQSTIASGVRTTGRVVQLLPRQDEGPSETGFDPIVEFVGQDGRTYRGGPIICATTGCFSGLTVGSEVPIIYDPAYPRRVFADTEQGRDGMWPLLVVLAAFACWWGIGTIRASRGG